MTEEENHDSIPTIRLQGRLDAYQVPAINEKFEAIFARSSTPRVIVNLLGVAFIDSAAVEAMVAWLQKARQGNGDIKLSSLRQTVRMRFKIEQLSDFEIYANDKAALDAFDEDKT